MQAELDTYPNDAFYVASENVVIGRRCSTFSHVVGAICFPRDGPEVSTHRKSGINRSQKCSTPQYSHVVQLICTLDLFSLGILWKGRVLTANGFEDGPYFIEQFLEIGVRIR
jgi:hypothetical protein